MNQRRDPYEIVYRKYVTEKSTMLSQLKKKENNRSIRRCQTPKYVFLVNPKANKTEIAWAVEEIYAEKNIHVAKVNTVTIKGTNYARRGNRQAGCSSSFKKAIVSLQRGDSLDD
jgi:large subunit ribosomal protein L23